MKETHIDYQVNVIHGKLQLCLLNHFLNHGKLHDYTPKLTNLTLYEIKFRSASKLFITQFSGILLGRLNDLFIYYLITLEMENFPQNKENLIVDQ